MGQCRLEPAMATLASVVEVAKPVVAVGVEGHFCSYYTGFGIAENVEVGSQYCRYRSAG